MPRALAPELLDSASAADAALNLRDIAFLNRWFGGHAILRRSLRAVAQPHEKLTIADIGAASGDHARIAKATLPQATVISLDLQPRNLALAPDPRLIADAFALPFKHQSIDIVTTALFLHHFTDQQIIELLRSFRSIAKRAVIVQDLERHPIAHAFLPATKAVFRWHPLTVHDGSISVAAAFTKNELAALLEAAGFAHPNVTTHGLAFRLSAILRK